MSAHLPIASFDYQEPAAALARRLNEDGVEAFTQDDTSDQLILFMNAHPRAQYHVLVPADKADAALSRLKELDASEQVLRDAIRCPDCGSSQIEFPQFSRKTLMGSVFPALAAAAGLIERQFYCTACQFTWAPEASDSQSPALPLNP